MRETYADYLAAVETVYTRPLSRREKNTVASMARRSKITLEAAEKIVRDHLAYYENTAGGSILRSYARGDVTTVVAQ